MFNTLFHARSIHQVPSIYFNFNLVCVYVLAKWQEFLIITTDIGSSLIQLASLAQRQINFAWCPSVVDRYSIRKKRRLYILLVVCTSEYSYDKLHHDKSWSLERFELQSIVYVHSSDLEQWNIFIEPHVSVHSFIMVNQMLWWFDHWNVYISINALWIHVDFFMWNQVKTDNFIINLERLLEFDLLSAHIFRYTLILARLNMGKWSISLSYHMVYPMKETCIHGLTWAIWYGRLAWTIATS